MAYLNDKFPDMAYINFCYADLPTAEEDQSLCFRCQCANCDELGEGSIERQKCDACIHSSEEHNGKAL